MSLIPSIRQWCRPRLWLLWLPGSILWLELVLHVYAFRSLFDRGLIYTVLFSVAIGALLTFLFSLFPPKARRVLTAIALCVIFVWFMAQTVYFDVFTTFLTLFSVGTGAGDVTQYWREILHAILYSLPALLLEALPVALFFWKGRRSFPEQRTGKGLCCALFAVALVFHTAASVSVQLTTTGLLSPRYLYRDTFIPELSVSNFGVLTTLRLDAQQLFFGERGDVLDIPAPSSSPSQTTKPDPQPDATPDASATPSPEVTPEPIVWEENVLNIDFSALAQEESNSALRELHEYFGSREATSQNEYTGLFEGKNLIYITAEAFSPYAVDPELTPTLYKLANSGFVFENFYAPLWWVSTSDGEYVNCQSLIPKSGVWSMYRSGNNTLPFTLGNQFLRLGYDTYAYHNHYYDYYARDVSHPNMGYDYKGEGGGLDLTNHWPPSDLEMMEVTAGEYMDGDPFHVYYMTVSGHMNYTFMGNSMSSRHKDKVAHLDLSEECRAYLACNIELDLALEYLLEQLEQAGILEDTVICLAPDHYPYGLDKQYIDELAGHTVEENFELYHSTLILWSGDMEESVIIDKPCSTLDILPTLSNLFGLEYDSRLLMGRDILSDSEGLVVFSNHSFLTEYGRYNARTDTFTPYDGVTVSDTYAIGIMEQVNDMFQYSVDVLDYDYYSTLGLFEDPS